MKKLLLLSLAMFFAISCTMQDESLPAEMSEQRGDFVPPLYGMAMLEEGASPESRGVADILKVWSRPMAQSYLTVKFLNGTDAYKDYVKDVAQEWEKNAGVRFIFVEDQDAMIRVGFDYVAGMMSSWALTGTDHISVYGRQDEATVHFAQWRRASNSQKRSDVLRAFGQVLGLELEFRHPDFYPGWITDSSGNIDEATIRDYWEYELAGYISWEELKKIVLDPLAMYTPFIEKTEYYDELSVMTWPFYEMIANNIPVIEFDEYNTELSERDKEFIKSLYGESLGTEPRSLDLIEFDYGGTNLTVSVKTNKDLMIVWDQETRESTRITVPEGTDTYIETVEHRFPNLRERKIVISEILGIREYRTTSTAMIEFDLSVPNDMGDIDIKSNNKSLEKIRIAGGFNFKGQTFNFTDWESLKELYLVRIKDSKIILDNCPNLEVVATTSSLIEPLSISGPEQARIIGTPRPGGYYEVETPVAEWPATSGNYWPSIPEYMYSIYDYTGDAFKIRSCPNIRAICLENNLLMPSDHGNRPVLNNLPNLEYLYLSSVSQALVGGALKPLPGGFLLELLETLCPRDPDKKGIVVLRGINDNQNQYVPVHMTVTAIELISEKLNSLNWTGVWDSGCLAYINI